MKNLFISKIILVYLTLGYITSCASPAQVFPGETSNRSVFEGQDRKSTLSIAIRGAKEYCEKKNQEAIYLKEDVKYFGDNSEETNKKIGQLAELGKILIGGRGNSKVREAEDTLKGDSGYKATVRFKCR